MTDRAVTEAAAPAARRLSRDTIELSLGCILLAAMMIAAPWMPAYYVGICVQAIVMATFALGVNLLLGYCGLPSLGHALHLGIGAYIVGLLGTKAGFGFFAAISSAIALGCVIGLAVAVLALRTTGIQFLMVTLAFAEIVHGIAISMRWLTGGDDGLPGIARPAFLGDPVHFLYFATLLFFLCFLATYIIVRSPFGATLQGIRESELRMRALGYNTLAYKIIAYVLAALFATIAGIISAYFNRFVSTHDVGVLLSGYGLLVVILGGAGTILGPVVGTIIFMVMQHIVSSYTERWMMILGVIFILVMLFAPQGLIRLRARSIKDSALFRALIPTKVQP